MKLELESALRYPFRKDGWVDFILLPGINLLLVNLLFYGALWAIFMGNGGTHSLVGRDELFNPQAVLQKMRWMIFLSSVCLPPLVLLSGAWVIGFYRAMIARLQTVGLRADPPSWLGQWPDFWKQGLPLGAYGLLVQIPLVIATLLPVFFGSWLNGLAFVIQIVWLFLIPFWMVPVLSAAQQSNGTGLFNFAKTVRLGKCVYGKGMTALIVTLILSFVYAAVGFLLTLITCGFGALLIPFLMSAFLASACHLWVQAYAELASSGQTSFSALGRMLPGGDR